ncbi:MAG: hypothetical protein PWR01_2841 [Clostridiales bacterium]|jgi:uncharacterized protein (TIGR02421 family)|nr:hypothetical protein [Clostridiales bacterium]MDN5281768.1 hypothetical protein [Candidatus Ozemobacter sp.]
MQNPAHKIRKAKIPASLGLLLLALAVRASCLTIPQPTPDEVKLDLELAQNRKLVAFSSRINPETISQKVEKEKFFTALKNHQIYNPFFTYESRPEEIEKVAEFKPELVGAKSYAQILNRTAKNLSTQAQMLLTNDAKRFADLSCQLYPAPETWLVLEAHRLVRELNLKEEEKNISPNELAEILQKGLEEYRLHNWKIKIARNMAARASVSPAARKVKINSTAFFSAKDARRLILHEIGVHASRAENGSKRPLKIFTTGFPGYLATEEGLAVYNEVSNGITEGLPLFALRVLGVHWALKNSFHDTFQLLRQVGADKETAWRITTRCKRGLKDTSRPGAYTKDASYLRGFYMIKAARKIDPAIFEKLLKVGKIGVEDLKSFF